VSISRIVLSAALALAVAVPVGVVAQTPPSPPTSPAPHRGMYAGALRGITLSDQQRAQIQALMAQYRQAHPRGSQPDPQARRQLVQSVLNVLTPAQRAQYNANIAQLRSQRGAGPFPTPGGFGDGMRGMFNGITLSAQQRQQIDALVTQFHQTHGPGSRPDAQALEQLHQSILNLLTPAQRAQFSANMAAMRTGTGGAPIGPGAARMGRMFEGITLSDQQQQQIETIVAQFRQAHPLGSRPDAQAREQLRQSILNVLTPAQQAQYNANRKRLEAERQQRDSNAPFPEASPTPMP